MSDFQELIKNFSRIREYIRQFYIYGFKVRKEYDRKSGRTYDNERRRIEAMLSNYTQSIYTPKGKQVYINVDSKSIPENPLYAAWKSKSFTNNDLMLHFFLPDLLWEVYPGKSVGELTDELSTAYDVLFDQQTVRLKCREYEKIGIFQSIKIGKTIYYCMAPDLLAKSDKKTDPSVSSVSPDSNRHTNAPGASSVWGHLITALKFYQGAAPLGVLGSTILDREDLVNDLFQFKHHFIVHTLEDGILLKILEAIHEERYLTLENMRRRSKTMATIYGLPLKILVSTQTGRRYLCMYLPDRRRFNCIRLDAIYKVEPGASCSSCKHKQELLQKNLRHCWGVSFGQKNRMEEIHIKLHIDENKESHILDRLSREGRGGELLKIRQHEYLYSGQFFDTNEMLSWVKTFTGRILDIQGSNQLTMAKIRHDWEEMYQMYWETDS